MTTLRSLARLFLWALTAGGAIVWLFIVLAQPWAWWSWNLRRFGWDESMKVEFRAVAVNEGAGGLSWPLILGPNNIWELTMMSCVTFVACCAALRMSLADNRSTCPLQPPAGSVLNTLRVRAFIQFRRAMAYQLPPRKFWLWLAGGMSGLDACVGGFFLGLDLVWMLATFHRLFVYHDNTFEDYGPDFEPVNKYTAFPALAFAWAIVPQLLIIMYPVPRSCFLHWMFGTEMPRIIKYHRWLGHLFLWNVSLHGLFHYITWWGEGIWLEQAFRWNNTSYVNHLCGSVAWIIGVVVWLASTNWVRRHYYRVFYMTHCLGISLLLLFSFAHYPKLAVYAVTGWFFYLLDLALRLFQRQLNSSTAFCTLDTGAQVLTVRLTFLKETNVLPTQYVYVKFPTVNAYQRHPFSIASISRDPATRLVSVILHIKALGPWTEKLQAANGEASQVPVLVEGPYGNVSFKWRTAKVLVLLAGGIGVTPILTILEDIMLARARGAPAPTHVYFVWMSRNVAEFQLLSSGVFQEAASWPDKLASTSNDWLHLQLCDTSKGAAPVVVGSLVPSTKDSLAARPLRGFGYGYIFYCVAFLSSALGAYAALLPSQAYQAYGVRTRGFEGYSTWLAGLTHMVCVMLGTMAPPILLASCVEIFRAVRHLLEKVDVPEGPTATLSVKELPAHQDVEALPSHTPGVATAAPDAYVKRGRPDIPHMLADIRAKHSDVLEMLVYASGPKAMWRTVRDECQACRGTPYPDCHMLSLAV